MALSAILGEAIVAIRGSLDEFRKDLEKARDTAHQALGKAMTDVGKGMRDVGRRLNTYLTLPIVGAGAAAVKLAGDFEYSMNVLRAVSGATSDQMERMRKLAIQLGNDTKLPATSAIDAAQAMTELVKAGLSVEQAMKAARGVLIMSAAAEISNAEAAEIAANALNAFGLSGDQATRVADLLANAANAASGEMVDIAYALRQAAAVSHMAGQSIEDVVAAIGLMANAGIQGSDAGTSLKQMFLSLINPTDKAAELMKQYGISILDARGQLKPLPQLIEEFRTKLGALPPAQRNAALATIFGSDAIRAANIVLMASQQEWEKMRAAVTRAGGAQEVAAAKMEGFRGALEKFRSALETAGIVIGERLLPPLTGLITMATGLLDWFTQLPTPIQNVVLAVAGFAAVLGPALVVLGAVTAALGSLITTGPVVVAALGSITTAAAPLLAAFGALAMVAYLIWQNWSTIGPQLAALWEDVKARVQPALSSMRQAIGDMVAYVQERWPQIKATLQTFLDWIGPIFETVWGFVKDTVLFYIGAITNIIQGAVNVITGIIKMFAAILSGDWRGAWEAIKQIVQGAIQFLWGFFQVWIVGRIAGMIGGVLNKILGWITGFVAKAIGAFTGWVTKKIALVAQWASNMVSKAWNAMNGMLQAIIRGIGNILARFGSFVWDCVRTVGTLGGRMTEIGRNIVQGLWNGISALGGWLKSKILDWARAVIPGPVAKALGISSPSRLMMQYGRDIVRGLALGMENNMRLVEQAAFGLAGVVAAFGDSPTLAATVEMSGEADAPTPATAGAPTPIIIERMYVRSEEDIYAISRELYNLSRPKLRARGMHKGW